MQTYKDTVELVTACREAGVQYMDGTMWLHNPRAHYMKEILSNKKLFGDPKSVTTCFYMGGELTCVINHSRQCMLRAGFSRCLRLSWPGHCSICVGLMGLAQGSRKCCTDQAGHSYSVRTVAQKVLISFAHRRKQNARELMPH